MGIKSNLNRLNRLINHHIGLGGNVHAAVNDFNAGFMTPEIKADLEAGVANAKGEMQQMPAGTDVLTLPAGNYEISGAKNNPVGSDNTAWIEYEIHTAGEQRRQIKAVINTNGRTYYRTVHTGGTATSGTGMWTYEPFLIWNGAATTGTLTFDPAPLKLQNGIRVRYLTKTNQAGNCDIMGTSTGTGAIDVANVPDDDTLQIQIYEMLVSFTAKSLTIQQNKTVLGYPSSLAAGADGEIMITGIYAI